MEDFDQFGIFAGIAGAASSVIPGSITVASITSPAAGLAGLVGMTTTTAVTVPIAAPIIIGAGIYLGYKYMKDKDNSTKEN